MLSLREKWSRPVSYLDWCDVHVGAQLGRGKFNSVFKVDLVRHGENTVLQPDGPPAQLLHVERLVLKCPNSSQRGKDTESQATEDLKTEAKILLALPDHPNVIHIHAVSSNLKLGIEEKPNNGLPFLLLERLDQTLGDHLHRLQLRADLEESNFRSLLPLWMKRLIVSDQHSNRTGTDQHMRLKTICLPIAEALAFLHEHEVIYRDLKPDNIGFSSITGKIKLFDFGLSRFLPSQSRRLTPLTGTLRYMAPEIRQEHPACDGTADYDVSCDVYSYGLLVAEVCTLQRYPSKSAPYRQSAFTRGIHAKAIRQLSRSCVNADPSERPSMDEVLWILFDQLERSF